MSSTAPERSRRSGDEVVITCPISTHRGKRATLVQRHVGRIAGRAWWTLRLRDTGAITSEFEDSLLTGAVP